MQSRSIGMHPLYLGLPVALACNFAFLLPMSCVPNAFTYTRGYFTQLQMVFEYDKCLLLIKSEYTVLHTRARTCTSIQYCPEVKY